MTMGSTKRSPAVSAGKAVDGARYVLRLYVAGLGPRSADAIHQITVFCENHLADDYELEIIDIYQKPALAREGQIVAVPTLIKELPSPLRRLIGDLRSDESLWLGLDLRTARSAAGN